MDSLAQEAALFRDRKAREIVEARQRVALRLSCGIELPDTGAAPRESLMQALARINRAIQRERMKAATAHWSYDLNRHIALTQVRDELQRFLAGRASAEKRTSSNGNGARRRRHVWHA